PMRKLNRSQIFEIDPDNRPDFREEDQISKSWFGTVIIGRIAPGVLVKFSRDIREESICTRYAKKNTSIPVPRVFHSTSRYMSMEEIPGVRLDNVIGDMQEHELDCIASQLKSFLSEMRK